MEAAHYSNANIENRHSLPLATRFALLGESEGGAVSPSSDPPRSRIEGVRRCGAYAGDRSGAAVPPLPLHPPIFHRSCWRSSRVACFGSLASITAEMTAMPRTPAFFSSAIFSGLMPPIA